MRIGPILAVSQIGKPNEGRRPPPLGSPRRGSEARHFSLPGCQSGVSSIGSGPARGAWVASPPRCRKRSAKLLDFTNFGDQITHRLVPIARSLLNRSHHDLIGLFGGFLARATVRSAAASALFRMFSKVSSIVAPRNGSRIASISYKTDAGAENIGPLVDATVTVNLLG